MNARDDDAPRAAAGGVAHEIPTDTTYASEEDGAKGVGACGGRGTGGIIEERARTNDDDDGGGGGGGGRYRGSNGDVGGAAKSETEGDRDVEGDGDDDEDDDDDDDDDENVEKEDDHADNKRREEHQRPSHHPPIRTNNNGVPSSSSQQQNTFFEPTNNRDYYHDRGYNNNNAGFSSKYYDQHHPSSDGYAPHHNNNADHPPNYDSHHRHHFPYASYHHHQYPMSPYGNVGIDGGFLPPPNLLPPPQQLPLSLPPPPPPPPPSSSVDLDAARQYYEARMREHAMQYANAAAGAAWAAARIACGGVGFDAMPPPPPPPPNVSTDVHRQQSYYTPAPPPPHPHTSTTMNPNHMSMTAPWCQDGVDGGVSRQKRTLWHHNAPPPFGNIRGNKTRKATTAAAAAAVATLPPPPYVSQLEKMRSKKRESGGNDSTSSLGSESREHVSMGHRDKSGDGDGDAGRGKYAGKKSNQRRRFNEEGDGACATGDVDKQKDDNNRTDCADVRQKDDGNNQRQKRGLNHGHSSKSSFSSLGSSINHVNDGINPNRHSVAERNKKKKNRSQQPETPHWQSGQNESNFLSPSAAPPSSVFLGGLIGKNGVRALHELCSKYRWDMPIFTPVEPPPKSAIRDDGVSRSSSVGNSDISFVLKVHINGFELGSGRGGTKASAKHDASRKALSALVPGVVFDPNGILLDTGGSKPLLRGSSHVDVGGGGAPDGNGSLTRSNYAGSEPLSLDELGPHLASQLAIGGDGVVHGRLSPDHSETSSISTAISEEVFPGGPLISGGPILLSHKLPSSRQLSSCGTLSPLNPADGTGRFFLPNIYPSASTTSGVSGASSASEVDAENAYYSSRGASVCSTLLHAMWQIDDRIWEPPSYSFDLCPGPCNSTGNIECGESFAASGIAVKRKKSESSHEFAGHRMFQCTATLNLYIQKNLVGDRSSSIMEFWESPLDYLQSNWCSSPYSSAKGESLQSRKRKDDDGSAPQSTPSTVKDVVEAQEGDRKTPKKRDKGDFFQHKLESTGTGLTKRESKHKASAKLLATLFPECSSMVEVKAEAEAARELYAAKREAIQTKRPKIMFLSAEKKDPTKQSAIPIVVPTKNDISLHALSLSEPKDGTKRMKWCDSMDAASSFEVEVDAVLQCLQDSDEEGRWITRGISFEDVGKIVLRRACCDDSDHIYVLMNKSETVSTALPPLKQQVLPPYEPALTESDAPPESGNVGQDHDDDNEENSTDGNGDEKRLGDHSVILVLARAVALHHPPLGCAILTVKNSACDWRSLSLDRLGHEEHLPRERFIESLATFAKNMNCTLETDNCHHRLAVTLDDIRSFLARSRPPLYHTDDVVDCIKGGSSRRHLQSVKEEESEEVDDGSDGGEDRNDKLADGSTEIVKRKPWKPSSKRRKRLMPL